MGLLSLSLRNFRCFTAADLEFAPTLNLIYGENASGKTSLIESIFILGRGRSFKTANLDTAVRSGTPGFQITGKAATFATPVYLGVVRENGRLQAKVAEESSATLAQLSQTLPIQLVDNQAHQLIQGGPRGRRQFLDWGVFHVEPTFFPAWRRYQRALQQRNALLRAGKSRNEIKSWDGELVNQGKIIDQLRREYLENLLPIATVWAGQALGGLEIGLEYRPGWPEDLALLEALETGIERDCYAGMTQVGPHRADMRIGVDGKAAQEWVSRGQEKTLVGSLLLAQAALYRAFTDRPCTLLLDDLAAELDTGHLERFLDRVVETGAQTYITAIDRVPLIMDRIAKVFHVKQGNISSMI